MSAHNPNPNPAHVGVPILYWLVPFSKNVIIWFWQVWLCGGSIEVIPCSKIAHIERERKPYLPDLSVTMKRNALRVAEVWMDEYKRNVNIAWNLPLVVRVDTASRN